MSNTNLFTNWQAKNTSNYLGEGIHDNCVIAEVDIEPRKKQDGTVMKVAMFVKYFQVDETGKPLAQIEDMHFWPKHDGRKGPIDSAMRYMERLAHVLTEVGYDADAINNYLNPFPQLGINTPEEMEAKVKSAKGMKEFTQATNELFKAACEQVSGPDSQYKFRLKVVYSDNGRGVEVSRGATFMENMSVPLEQSKLKFTDRDIRARQEAQKPKSATNLGSAPSGPGAPGMPSAPGTPSMPSAPGMPGAAAATTQAAAPQQAPAPQQTPTTQAQPAQATPAPQNAVAEAMQTAPQAQPQMPFLNQNQQ